MSGADEVLQAQAHQLAEGLVHLGQLVQIVLKEGDLLGEEGVAGAGPPHFTPEVRTTRVGANDPGYSATPEDPPEE